MQRFYILRLASEPDVTGVDESEQQSEIKRAKFINKYNYDSLIRILGSNEYWNYKEKLSEQLIAIERVELSGNAILTDFLQYSPALINCPFLFSARVHKILKEVNENNFNLYQTFVFDGKDKYEYHLIHIDRINDELIDFDNSVFCTGNDLLGDKQLVRFTSSEEKVNFARDNFDLRADVLSIKTNDSFNPDIFALGNGEVIISEAIKTKLDELKVTGVHTLPAFGAVRHWPEIRFTGQ